MGCSHFVVGRDHTGVGKLYSSDASQKLFDQLGDIGISPIMFPPIAYDAVDRLFKEEQLCTSPKAISGTEMRKCLSREENLPNWFISDEVQEVLLRHVRLSEPLTHN
jgi:ATP sulfurylase